MYIPRHFGLEDRPQISEFVAAAGAAHLVTFDGAELTATLLPVIWDQDDGTSHAAPAATETETDRLRAPARPHRAGQPPVGDRAARRSRAGYRARAAGVHLAELVRRKREHGRVVPTWNYVTVHFTGPVTFHRDPEWLRGLVTRLTTKYEGQREQPWHVTDAPPAFIDGQLRGIVGVEMTVTRVEAKAKLSQNRGAADRAGAIEGLRGEDDPGSAEIADLMVRREAEAADGTTT